MNTKCIRKVCLQSVACRGLQQITGSAGVLTQVEGKKIENRKASLACKLGSLRAHWGLMLDSKAVNTLQSVSQNLVNSEC